MGTYIIKGEKHLRGEINVGGAKNAVLPILAACILSEEDIVLHNCPMLSDVENTVAMMREMGCHIKREKDTLIVNTKGLSTYELPTEYSKKMRSSIFMLGSLVSRMKRATANFPGGCEIGLRPIDLHIKGLSQMNISVTEEDGKIHCVSDEIIGTDIVLDYASVGATENVLMAAVLAKGTTVIHNAAREPEIVDLQNFLNSLGAKIKGAGTGKITIKGTGKLSGGTYRIMGDRIVAGTFLVAGAITYGDVTVNGVCPEHLQSVLAKLEECGCQLKTYDDAISIKVKRNLGEIASVTTAPYPGFPTDMQAQIFALCTVCDGTGIIVENVFENRFRHSAQLMKMGANVIIKDRMAIIKGVERLRGTTVEAMDLRGGAALVLAGLNASGVTRVTGTEHIHRGYESFAYKLLELGADITEE